MTRRAAQEITVGSALAAFRAANGLSADEALKPSWPCRLGPLEVRLPNFRWRRRAILAHDVHHVLTEYPCMMRGEFQMAAWEFGAGRIPHWAAAWFCLPLVLAGLAWSPARIARAFLDGRRSRSLHGTEIGETLLAVPLSEVRSLHARSEPNDWCWKDLALFAALILRALSAVIPVAALAVGLGLAVSLL